MCSDLAALANHPASKQPAARNLPRPRPAAPGSKQSMLLFIGRVYRPKSALQCGQKGGRQQNRFERAKEVSGTSHGLGRRDRPQPQPEQLRPRHVRGLWALLVILVLHRALGSAWDRWCGRRVVTAAATLLLAFIAYLIVHCVPWPRCRQQQRRRQP